MSDSPTVQLSSAAHVFVRPGPALQFGVDATRAGIIDIIDAKHMPGIVAAFLSARNPISKDDLSGCLIQAGLDRTAAEALIAELLAYRVLRHTLPPTRHISIMGHSLLTQVVGELFTSCGYQTRSSISGESDEEFLHRTNPNTPLLVIDRLPHARRLAPLLVDKVATFIPVSLVDGRGIIGPLHIAGVGPCPLCVDLHRANVDKHWLTLLAQLSAHHHDPLVAHSTASRLVSVVDAVLGYASEPPGASPLQLRPGDIIEVNPYAIGDDVTTLESHSLCPVCFMRK